MEQDQDDKDEWQYREPLSCIDVGMVALLAMVAFVVLALGVWL